VLELAGNASKDLKVCALRQKHFKMSILNCLHTALNFDTHTAASTSLAWIQQSSELPYKCDISLWQC
jgi:hypothetical protein